MRKAVVSTSAGCERDSQAPWPVTCQQHFFCPDWRRDCSGLISFTYKIHIARRSCRIEISLVRRDANAAYRGAQPTKFDIIATSDTTYDFPGRFLRNQASLLAIEPVSGPTGQFRHAFESPYCNSKNGLSFCRSRRNLHLRNSHLICEEVPP